MKNQRRTIMGACDYSIATLQNLKKDLMDFSAVNQELNWAIGGIVVTLTSQLIRICDQVFQESVACGDQNAKQDICEIQSQLNALIEQMIQQD